MAKATAAKKAPATAASPKPAVPRIAAPRGYRQVSSILVDAGGSSGAKLLKGQVVRFTDLEGRQAVDFLCNNASDTRDRYNAASTMKMAESLYLNTGTVLHSEYATPLMKVVASNCPNHDTIGGCCSVEVNQLRYNRRTQSCRSNFLRELGKFRMGEPDVVANVNWFMSVPIGGAGHMAISDGPSKPGVFGDVEALTDMLAVISNCPQKYNPACGYNPTPVQVEVYSNPGR